MSLLVRMILFGYRFSVHSSYYVLSILLLQYFLLSVNMWFLVVDGIHVTIDFCPVSEPFYKVLPNMY